MEFHPSEPFDSNRAQRNVWDSLKQALAEDRGVAYYRYHIFPRGRMRHREPDILILHPALGLIIIECKGCRIENIAAIQGAEWTMQNWHDECETPLEQAADQMFAVKGRYLERRETRDLLAFHFTVALPFVTRAEWQAKGFDRLTEGGVILKEDLYPGSIRHTLERLAAEYPQKMLSDSDWEAALSVLRGRLTSAPPRHVPSGTPSDSAVRVIRVIESGLKVLDRDQNTAAFAIPDGPQRLRGLAGTGKTVLLAQRAAKIHARHPDWRIAFVFWTKSLYEQVRQGIESAYAEMTGETPDWNRLNILHAWGNKRLPGFYSTVARACKQRPLGATEAAERANRKSPGAAFDFACELFNREFPDAPPLFDAILIDEGQDLPPGFYRLVYSALKKPKRLYWAYDEAQGIGSLTVPTPAVVFGERSGKPVVDLSGKYDGGIDKSQVFRRCYRTPQRLLMVAHALNMGLLRPGGPLQGITTQVEWEKLGYQVDGDFRKVGAAVEIRRHPDTRCHPIDRDQSLNETTGSLIVLQTFRDEAAERAWIARQVASDIKGGLQPTDLLITPLGGDSEKDYLDQLQAAMQSQGLKVWRPGYDESTDFRREGHVTVANIHRAKGNEAWKVYAVRFHTATRPLQWKGETELHKRNEAFVALTRTRVWCVATGLEGPIFDEMRRVIEQYPVLRFPAFTRKQLARPLADEGD
jgi:superfamily I DNA and RNA helicase